MRPRVLALGLGVALALATGCAAPVRMHVHSTPTRSCRTLPPFGLGPGDEISAADRAAPSPRPGVTWIGPTAAAERRRLDARCDLVGPPLLVTPAAPTTGAAAASISRLVVATWNLHDGRGDVAGLLADLQAGVDGLPAPDAVVLLLQEAVRTREVDPAPSGGARPSWTRDLRDAIAPRGWHIAYAPNRPTAALPAGARRADRGTAIVSSVPLSGLQAIELPVERQRRVTLAGVLTGTAAGGRRWRLRVASVHLENRPGPRRLWLRAGAARSRQAAALLEALELGPWPGVTPPSGEQDMLIVGGDFNTWLGSREGALARLREAFPAWPQEDRRATMRGRLRLDYLFARVTSGVHTTHRRLDRTYGSDHHPVVVALDFGAR